MAGHEDANPTAPDTAGSTREDIDQRAAALSNAGSSRRERLAGSAVGVGGGGPDSAGVYVSAEREGMAVEELLNYGQEEVFSAPRSSANILSEKKKEPDR